MTRIQAASSCLLPRKPPKAPPRSRARLDAGSIDFLVVLDAERELLLARDRLAQGQTNAAVALVGVYRALAGGW